MIDPVQAAIGIVVVLVVAGGLLFVFNSRTNAVEKTGYGALIMLSIVSLMIPVFWIMETNGETISKIQQHNTAVERGAALYAQYCFQCHGLTGQGAAGPKLNGNSAVDGLSDADVIRIISGGIPGNPANPAVLSMPAWSDQFGGPLTQEQIQYLFELIRSADPAYLTKNGYPTGPNANGFNQVPGILQQNQPSQYETAVAQATAGSGVGAFPTVDLTNQKSITVYIIDSPNGANCQPACFAVNDPKNPNQQIVSPNIKVKVGTTITWVNKSSTPHTVTSIIGENPAEPKPATVFDSGAASVIAPGGTFTYIVKPEAYTFNKNHIVVYYCRLHPVMTAALTISQ
ncbi:MAG TPA: c-type cytochrome [Ktedonobacteraceae bacterium]|jgi:mono/diheme cytochrome c family protein/plastocyanin|nr:c-type cytochrome [Ktedonobacteraceae bacterium]